MQKTSIISILLCMTVISAHGDIASTAYVDSAASDIQAQIDERANKSGYTPERILQTDGSGNVTADLLRTDMISDGAVTNSRLSSGLGLDKMDVGELPTSGKHIMIWNGTTQKYVFEALKEPLQCPAGTYDIGFEQCVDPGVNGNRYTEDSSTMTWSVTFNSYGTIEGRALCSSTSGEEYVAGAPDETPRSGGYCWCKMTSPSASRWVLRAFDEDFCASNCAYYCVDYVLYYSAFRSGVFGAVEL